MNNIISKWVVKYNDFILGITSDNRVFDLKTGTELVEYYNNGTLCFRIPKITKRIGIRTLRKHAVKKQVIIKEVCPF